MTNFPIERYPARITARRVQIGRVSVHDVIVPELVRFVRSAVMQGTQVTLYYANAHAVRLADQNPQFREDLAGAHVVFCDSFGVQLASRLLGQPLRSRMTPPAWLGDLVATLPARLATFYLLGDEAEVVSLAATKLPLTHPPSHVVGHHHGFFAMEGADNDLVVQRINEASPTVLLVGMGMPRQERWIAANGPRVRALVVMAVGALFRRIAGLEPRPHPWFVNHGFEWVTRLGSHPVTMFDRYVIGLPKFATIVARQQLRSWSPFRKAPPPPGPHP